MTRLAQDLLLSGVQYDRGVWTPHADLSLPEPWSEAALANPVHAAVSAVDEEHEAKKSSADMDVLLSEIADGDILFDGGCGYGRLAKYLLPHRVLAAYVGLDVSAVMLQMFRTRHAQHEHERRTPLLLVQGRLDEIRVKSEAVDVAVLCAVLLHNPKRTVRRILAEVHRILRPGGTLLVVRDFPNRATIAGVLGSSYLAALGRTRRDETNGPVRYYSMGEVRKYLVPFRDVQIHRNGFQLLPKSLIAVPLQINRYYRHWLHAPMQLLGTQLLPASARDRLYVNLTIIARK